METGAAWTMPPAARGSNRFLYFFAGKNLRIAGEAIAQPMLLVADPGSPLLLEAADAPVELLVLQGKPIAEPVAQYGPFVMNTREQLQQAFADYQRTQFGGWRWGRPDPVNGTQGRFALRPDGTVERPAR